MSRKRNKTAPPMGNVVMVRVPMFKNDWEEFREIVKSVDEKGNPTDVLYALVRAVINGDITVTRPAASPMYRS